MINIERTNDEVEHSEVTKNSLGIHYGKKQIGEMTFSCQNYAKNEKESAFFHQCHFVKASGFKIIDTSAFQGLVFALRCSIYKKMGH